MGQPVMYWQILSKRPADLAKFTAPFLAGTFRPRMLWAAGLYKPAARKASRAGFGRFRAKRTP